VFVVIGLRTLCLAVVDIDPKFYADWNQQYHIASSAVDNRQQLVEWAAECIEKVSFLSLVFTRLLQKPSWLWLCLSWSVCLSAAFFKTLQMNLIKFGIRNSHLDCGVIRIQEFNVTF